jgi:hypothetical protein
MGTLSVKSESHRYLSNFVDWIRPEEKTEDTIRKQADEIRGRISAKAAEDGLVVRSMPWAGSFAKKTGLRRHRRGQAEVEGQDIDLPFVVSPATSAGEDVKSLLDRFERYAQASYPNTSRNPTKSAVCLDFKSTGLSYDLVPMLAVTGDDLAQILLRSDGERRRTSVQKHIEFIRTRTNKSNEHPGRVKFNEGVRLVKWWREVRQSSSTIVSEVPTVVIDLLSAKAFDGHAVDETYTETLSRWFGRMANLVRTRTRVDFTDFVNPSSHGGSGPWVVLDPVNPDNNVIPGSWGNLELEELAEWLEEARDGMARVIAADVGGRKTEVKEELEALFGSAVHLHGEDA